MNARDALYARLTGACIPDIRADHMLDAYRAEILAEALADVTTWLTKKAREYRSTGRAQHRLQADVIDVLASKVARGAVRPNNLRMLPDPELERLRARVAELEAAAYVAPSPSCTRCYGADAERFVAKGGAVAPCRVCGPSLVEQLEARIAELESLVNDGSTRTVDEDPIRFTLTNAADELRSHANDPCHPCGCPKRFDRHADGCPGGAS